MLGQGKSTDPLNTRLIFFRMILSNVAPNAPSQIQIVSYTASNTQRECLGIGAYSDTTLYCYYKINTLGVNLVQI